jgi:hypothetical protein
VKKIVGNVAARRRNSPDKAHRRQDGAVSSLRFAQPSLIWVDRFDRGGNRFALRDFADRIYRQPPRRLRIFPELPDAIFLARGRW